MKKYLKAWTNLGLTVIALAILIFVVPKLIVFFMPFIVGWMVAWIASPMVRFFEEKFKIKRKASSVFVIVFAIAAVVLALYLIGARLVTEGISLLNDLPDMWQGAQRDFRDIADRFGAVYEMLPENMQDSLSAIKEQTGVFVGSAIEKISSPTIEAVGNFAKQLPALFIAVIIGLLVIWGISQLVRQMIQPKIVGDSIGVPPIPTLFLLYIGYKVAGVIGMIVSVPLGLVVYTMYEEEVFDTTINSIKILVRGINDFRKITEKDLEDSNGKRSEGRDE